MAVMAEHEGHAMPGDKRTFDERQRQLAAIEKALLSGRRPVEAVRAAVKSFNVSEASAWRDCKLVRTQWAERAALATASEAEFGRALELREQLYWEAMQGGDLALAFKIEQDRCKLLNLYPAVQVQGVERIYNCAVDERPTDRMTDAELLAAIVGEVDGADGDEGSRGLSSLTASEQDGAAAVLPFIKPAA